MSKSPMLLIAALLASLSGTAVAAQSSSQSGPGAPGAQGVPDHPASSPSQGAVRDARTRRIEGVRTMPYPPPASSAGGKAAQRPVDERHCLRQTGSHIPPKDGKCIPMPGRVYDKKDIDRTGETELGPALRKLDPSVGGH